MKSRLFLRGWLCTAALTASACVSLADLPIAREDAGEVLDSEMEEPDAQEPNAEVLDADVGPTHEADASVEDASADVDLMTPEDASMRDADASMEPVDASPKSCTKSSDCAADQACNGTQCVPRCTSYGACVVHETEKPTRTLISAGDAVYWVVRPSTDGLGNPRNDAELWRMAPGSTAVRLLKNLANVDPVIKGGYVYFSQGSALYRAPLQADATAQQLYMMETGANLPWVVGDSFLAFATSTGIAVGSLDGSAPLAQFDVAVPSDSPSISLIAGGDRIYFRVSGKNELSALSLNPFVVQKTPVLVDSDTRFGPTSFVRETTLYSECGPMGVAYLCGNDLNDGTRFTAAKVPDAAYSGGSGWKARTSFVAGDWAYRGYYSGEPKADLTRFSLVSVGVSQPVIPKDLKDAVLPGQPAAAGDRFYFLPISTPSGPSRLIYEMPLPPAPCASTLPCPNGGTCGTDSLCR